ncbi:MAG: type IV pilus modification protein PilV [Methylococcaceae bacterium]
MKLNNGFTLIEVLIALIILAGGMLGMAAMQAMGLKNNVSAYQRSQATQLAYNMADRMRANLNAAGTYATAATTASATQGHSVQASCLTTAGCSVANMAANDIYEWNAKVSSVLPSGEATITFSDPIYTITIKWDDDRDSTTNKLSFPMSFTL